MADTRTIQFQTGWNMFSLPLATSLSYGDIATQCPVASYIWKYNSNSGYYEKVQSLQTGYGYWVKMKNSCSVIVSGNSLQSNERTYLNGWNQIGANTLSVSFGDISSGCTVTSGPWRYNPLSGQYEEATVIEPGKGYLVKVSGACGSEPEPSTAQFQITVDSNSVVDTNKLSVGINLMSTSEMDQWLNRASQTQLSNDAKFKFVRLYTYNLDPLKSDGTYNWAQVDALVQKIINSGAEPIIALGFYDGSGYHDPKYLPKNYTTGSSTTALPTISSFADYCREWVRHFNSKGWDVKYYEIMNEAFFYFDSNFNFNPTKAKYFLDLYNAAYNAMHAEKSNLIIGNDASLRTNFLNFWKSNGGKLDMFTNHKYDVDNMAFSDSNGLVRAEKRNFDPNYESLMLTSKEARQIWGSNLPSFFTEMNWAAFSTYGTDPRIQKIIGATHTALVLRQGMLEDVDGIVYFNWASGKNWESTKGGSQATGGFGFALVNSDDNQPWFPYYVLKWVGSNLNVGDSIVSSTSNSGDIRSVSWLNNGKLNILLIHKSTGSKTVSIQGISGQLSYEKIDDPSDTKYTRPWENIQTGTVSAGETITLNGYTVMLLQQTGQSQESTLTPCTGTISVTNDDKACGSTDFTITARNTGPSTVTAYIADEVWTDNNCDGTRESYADGKGWSGVSILSGGTVTRQWTSTALTNPSICYLHTIYYCSQPFSSSNSCYQGRTACWDEAYHGNIAFSSQISSFKCSSSTQSQSFVGISSIPRQQGPTSPYALSSIDEVISVIETENLNIWRMSFPPDFNDWRTYIQYFLDNSDADLIVDPNHYSAQTLMTDVQWQQATARCLEILEAFKNYQDRLWIEPQNEQLTDITAHTQQFVTAVRNAGYTNNIVSNVFWRPTSVAVALEKMATIDDPLNKFWTGQHWYFNSITLSSAQNYMQTGLELGLKLINTEVGADERETAYFDQTKVNNLNSFLAWCADRGIGNAVWLMYGDYNYPFYENYGLDFPTTT